MRLGEISERTLMKLHEKYASSVSLSPRCNFEIIWGDSVIVGNIAAQLACNYQKRTGIALDITLIKAGALVRNIGRYGECAETQTHIFAGESGSRILQKEGFPLELVVFPLPTSDQERRRKSLGRMGILEEKYFIPTIEELMVRYAKYYHYINDLSPRFLSSEDVHQRVSLINRKEEERLITLEDEFGIPDLSQLTLLYREWHKTMKRYNRGLIRTRN